MYFFLCLHTILNLTNSQTNVCTKKSLYIKIGGNSLSCVLCWPAANASLAKEINKNIFYIICRYLYSWERDIYNVHNRFDLASIWPPVSTDATTSLRVNIMCPFHNAKVHDSCMTQNFVSFMLYNYL